MLKVFAISFSNILLSLPFTYLGLSKFGPNEIKAYWQPPGYIFGIVWTILYFLFGIINLRTFYSTNMLIDVKTSILLQSLSESFLQTLWLLVTSKFGKVRYPIQYYLGFLVMSILVYFAYKVRKPTFNNFDNISYWLYFPYTLWIVFAWILNLQIVYKLLFTPLNI